MERKEFSLNNNISKTSPKFLFATSEKNLLSHKSFIRNILDEIKTYQSYCLIKNQNAKELKSFLTEIKNKLLSINKEKIILKKILENEIISNKSKLQNEIFDYYKQEKYNISNRNDNLNYLNEKNQLENLSFKVKNEIERIDFEIMKEVDNILNLKIERLYQEKDLEILTEKEVLKLKAMNTMKQNLKYHQHHLEQSLLEIYENKIKISKIRKQIEYIKRNLNNKKSERGNDYFLNYENIEEYNKKIFRNLSSNIRRNKRNNHLNFYLNFDIKNSNFVKSNCKSYKNNKKQSSNLFLKYSDNNIF